MTPLWTTREIAEKTAGFCEQDAAVSGVSIDTRSLKKGDLFVALKGDYSDGHDYIDAAIKAGAAAAIVSHDVKADIPLIKTEDTLKAMRDLGCAARDRSDALRIAVTGSAGKTGTKEMLSIVFADFGKTHHSVKSYNNHWGVPLTLSRMPQDTEYGVFEMGMNHAGEIADLTTLVQPHIAIITTILPVHLEHFENETGIARAKGEIVQGMDKDSVLILNADNPHFETLQKIGRDQGIEKIYGFGEDPDCDSTITDLKLGADGSKVKATILGEPVKFKLSIPGKHIALNALAVLTAVKAAGLNLERAAKVLSKAEPIEGRGQRSEVIIEKDAPPITIIDESYNANPAAMQAAFKVLEMCEPKSDGRRIAVLGDMLELGPTGPTLHADLANPLLKAKTDVVYTCGPQMEALFSTLPPPWQGAHEKDSFALCEVVTSAVKPGDVILIKGSLGSKMAYVVEALQNMRVTAPANSDQQDVA